MPAHGQAPADEDERERLAYLREAKVDSRDRAADARERNQDDREHDQDDRDDRYTAATGRPPGTPGERDELAEPKRLLRRLEAKVARGHASIARTEGDAQREQATIDRETPDTERRQSMDRSPEA